ncbi:MAG: phosphatase PAP2 family protein [Anaerolineales bacterium]|nr:phosphatase PAP2 family protein [Anaerolineales bacterium]
MAATLGFVGLCVLARQFDYLPIDLTITRGVQGFSTAWFAALMTAVSYPGYEPQAYVLAAALVGLFLVYRRRWEGVMIALTGGGELALVTVVKDLVQRPRPGADLVQVAVHLDSYSFPSGHVVFYTTVFGFVFFLIYTLVRPSALRTAGLAGLAALIGLVGLSRIYLGNHWASDVAAAYLLGSVWLAASIWLYRWGRPRFFAAQPGAPGETRPDDA